MNIFELVFDFVLISIAGLLIAFSPMLIITDLLIVLKSKRPLLHTVVLLGSVALPLLLLSLVAAIFIKPDSDISLRGLAEKISLPPLVDILIGITLIIYAIKRFRRFKYHSPDSVKTAKIGKAPPSKLMPLFMFGFFKTLLSVTNIFAILFVTKLITSNKLDPLLALLILFWTIAVGIIPFLIIIYYQKNRRQYLIRLQNKIDNILTDNIQLYLMIGLGALGTAIACFGLVQVVSRA
ncbi:MAG TPA: GAP family protein [Patescibacteria group bacterium]|nr:GAP family protein [Patescibacteria group bacterium]